MGAGGVRVGNGKWMMGVDGRWVGDGCWMMWKGRGFKEDGESALTKRLYFERKRTQELGNRVWYLDGRKLTSLPSSVISDPDDPKFDLEALLNKTMKETK